MNQIDSKLYILIFPEKDVLKIGKANDIASRISTLKRYWGAVDHKNSCYLKAPESTVFKIEKSLHLLLEARRVDFDFGDGKTEFFSIDALELVKKYLEVYISDKSANCSPLIQGIPEITPLPNASTAFRKRRREILRLTNKIHKAKESLEKGISNYIRARRLIIYLQIKSDVIPYEYTEDNGEVAFTIFWSGGPNIISKNKRKQIEELIYNLISFQFDEPFDQLHNCGRHFCMWMESGADSSTFHFDFRELSEKCSDRYFYSLAMDLLEGLRRLPQKSPSLTTLNGVFISNSSDKINGHP